MIPWRTYLIGGSAGLALIAAAALYIQHLRHANAELTQKYERAAATALTNSASAQINDRRAANTAKAYRKAEEGRRAIQESTDLDGAIAEWGSALDGVRTSGHQPVAPGTDGR